MDANNKSASDKLSRECILVLVLVAILTLTDTLDSTIVNISLKDIAGALGCDMSWTSWIIIAYTLPTIGFIVIFGKVMQARAIKKILLASVIMFGFSSAMCGMCNDIETLVTFRIVQGISGAALLSATPILIVRKLPESKISVGMAVMAIITGIATTVGPTVGALLTEALSWRSIFYINVPICIFLVIFILTCFKDMDKNITTKSMPNLGVCVCYALSTMMFVYVVTSLEDGSLDFAPILYVVLLAVSFITGYYVYRSCCRDKSGHPLFRETLVKNREVILCTLSFICTTITAAIVTYLLPFYLRQALSIPSGEVGVIFGIEALITIVCSVIAGKWCQTHGCKSTIIVAIAFRIIFAFIFMIITPEMGLLPIYIAMVFTGASFGLSGTAQPTRIVQHAEKDDKEDASNIMLTGNYLGTALGVALCVIVMFVTIPGAYGIPVDSFTIPMLTDGMHYTAIFSIVVNIIALVCTLYVRNIIPGEDENKAEAVSQ